MPSVSINNILKWCFILETNLEYLKLFFKLIKSLTLSYLCVSSNVFKCNYYQYINYINVNKLKIINLVSTSKSSIATNFTIYFFKRQNSRLIAF